jgi:acyl transferase domain-containing protein
MIRPGGMFIDADPRHIDASFFKLTVSEATAMDPQQRQQPPVLHMRIQLA